MYKVLVVCLESVRRQSLKQLRELGSLHVIPTVPPSSDTLDDLRAKCAEVQQLLAYLRNMPSSKSVSTVGIIADPRDAFAVYEEVNSQYMELQSLESQMRALRPQMAQLEPWGDFDWSILNDLESRGWKYAFCSCRRKQIPSLPDGVIRWVIGEDKSNTYFFVMAESALDCVDAFRLQLTPDVTFADLCDEFNRLEREAEKCREKLRYAAVDMLPSLDEFNSIMRRKVVFQEAYCGMGGEGSKISYLQGYVPSDNLPALLEASRKNGWAVQYDLVTEDDTQVPTKLNIPKPFRMSQLIFDFVGVLPGYNETDVSIAVLIFLSLFCGMLVGDAGYGALFMIASGMVWIKAKTETQNDAGKLLFIMSSCIFVWGALTGNWFGWKPSPEQMHGGLRLFGGIPWLSEDENGAHVQLVSFFIGAIQLSLAHIWQALKHRRIREFLGNAGWAIFLWANFFVIQYLLLGVDFGKPTICMYYIATILILLFSINWKSAGDILYMPFQFINSAVDVMSYIRLYAVGLSGMCIAGCFNDMCYSVMHAGNPWIMVPCGILVGVLGHALNIALSCMGVMVHGIRLNTLEFSGHMGLEWGGRKYNPLKN